MHCPPRRIAFLSIALTLCLAAVDAGTPDRLDSRQRADNAGDPDPSAVVREAAAAVEAGSSGALRERWTARLRADSSDRAAALALATIARLTYDYEEAERLYGRLIGDAATADRYAVHARLGFAQAKDAQGRQRGMEVLLTEARGGARAAGDGAAEGEALFWQAHTLAGVYGGVWALARLDSALRVIPAERVDLRAASRCRRSQIVAVMGQPGADDTLTTAIAFAARSGDLGAQAICLRAAGVAQWLKGATDSAVTIYDSLAQLRRRMHDRSNVAVTLVLRADALRGQNRYGEAMRGFREALVEAKASRNLYIDATVKLGMGGIALTLNDHGTAATLVRHAVTSFDQAGDSASAMLARSFLPFVSLAAGDYARARQEVRAVLPWARQVGDWGHLVNLYTQLAAIEMRVGDWTAAERALDDATTTARRLGPAAEGSLLFPRGRLALYRGDLAEAERNFTRYVAGLDSVRQLERYEARVYLADVHARGGDLAAAEHELRTAGDALDLWRAGLRDDEMRTLAFQAGSTEANDRNASVARVIAALAAGGRAAAAFELSERRRARDLAERIVQAHALRGRDSSGRQPGDTGTKVVDPRRVVSASSAAIAEVIPDERTAVLEYVTGVMGAPTTLFVLASRAAGDSATLRAYVLPPADSVVDDIARFVALSESGGDAAELGAALARKLLAPAVDGFRPSIDRLIVVADGPLHRVPWDALRLSDGTYVVQRYAVALTPSATVLAELWHRSADRATARSKEVRLLAYGDPTFADERQASSGDSSSGADTYRTAFDSAGGLPRLRASAREARLVARYASDADVRLREGASAASLKRSPLDGFRVLHFATHALVDERSMTRSALALAPGYGESGFVGPGDLAALTLDADLVVLSACRSAGGVVVDGEGVQGLTGPLLEAGARSIVATRWRIGDRSTVAFVDEFYRGMARGLSVGDALRAAKVEAVGRGAPPREWAAFIAVGDPLVTIPLTTPRADWQRWALIALVGTLALAGVYWLRIRRRRVPDAR